MQIPIKEGYLMAENKFKAEIEIYHFADDIVTTSGGGQGEWDAN